MAFPQVGPHGSNPRAPIGGGGYLVPDGHQGGGTVPVAPGTTKGGVDRPRRLSYMSISAGQDTKSPIRVNMRSIHRHYLEPCGICQ